MKAICGLLLTTVSGAACAQTIWDNGPFDGRDKISSGLYAPIDHRAYDDFHIPSGVTWNITGFSMPYLWDTSGAGKTQGVDIYFYRDNGGMPDLSTEIIASVTSFTDVNAGVGQLFGRDVVLISGSTTTLSFAGGQAWWYCMQVTGPEEGFQLTTSVKDNPIFIKYSDLGNVLMPGFDLYGDYYDIDWTLTGSVVPEPAIAFVITTGIGALAMRRFRKQGRV